MTLFNFRKAVSAKAPNKIETMKKDYIKGEIEKLREKRVQVIVANFKLF